MAVPELKEPVSVAENYRPVSKRMIGNISILMGKVVPRDYPVFSTKFVSITDIAVGVGDTVKEGDVIAHGTLGDMSDTITQLRNQLTILGKQRVKEQRVTDERIKKLELERKNEKHLKDKKGMASKDTMIQVEKENLRFNLAMIDSSVSDINSQIAELEENSGTITFTAPYSGTVTYVKDVSHGNTVGNNENIAVISDMDDLYIETNNVTLDKYVYDEYKSKWITVDGKKVDITEHRYTNQEIAYANSVKRNPYMAFECPGVKLDIGTDIPLYFMKEKNDLRLSVGRDSIYYENDEVFVYVKNEKTGNNDKRQIELGATDEHYAEVVSGLEEGELVYYKNTMVTPDKYDVVDVTLSNYCEEIETEFFDHSYPYYDIYMSDVTGDYHKLKDIKQASEGDALFEVVSTAGKDVIEEARLGVVSLDNEKAQADKEYESAKKDLEKAIKQAKKHPLPKKATETDAVRNMRLLDERLECDLNILNIEHDFAVESYSINRQTKNAEYQKILKGTAAAPYTVTCKNNGVITYTGLNAEDKIEKGGFVVTVEKMRPDEERTGVFALGDSGNVKIGQQVKIQKEKDIAVGHVVGINGVPERYMLCSRNGQQYSTYSLPFAKQQAFQAYIEMDEKIPNTMFNDAIFKFNNIEAHNVIVVPLLCIKTEVDQLTQVETNYVWKLENDVPVKEYVEVYGEGNATGGYYVLSGIEVGDKVLK